MLGECKFTTSPKDLTVLHDLQKKSETILKLTQTKNARYILFSTSGFTKKLLNNAINSETIRLVENL